MRRKMIGILVWALGKLSKEYLVAISDGGDEREFMEKGNSSNLHLLSIEHVVLTAKRMEDAKMEIIFASDLLASIAKNFDEERDEWRSRSEA
ncbi:hypothetical protein [Selenomonas noxia]|uniref:hypothetical protein n=1 Tax=Selenomonas noxia TaxID=135083 RepID=UPI0028E23A6F|nr:hypothetical protein [Selenomonas noxia]